MGVKKPTKKSVKKEEISKPKKDASKQTVESQTTSPLVKPTFVKIDNTGKRQTSEGWKRTTMKALGKNRPSRKS